MKTFYSYISILLLFALFFINNAEAQPLTGTKTIKASGGDYSTFTLAINALNTNGVGTGGVIFNVDAGFTVTEFCPIITATGTVSNPITFQKSGAGANPIITAGTGGSTTIDGIIRISGGDYITFDGIDLKENAANTTTTTRMEFGYYIYNATSTNGAQYNTIKNCKITLNRLQTTSIGIYQYTATTSTSQPNGNNNYNKYYNFIVENSYVGIYLRATSATYFDIGCEIGTIEGGTTTIGAATANDIGNGSSAVYGIRASYQSGVQIFNATVRNANSTSNSARIAGIFLENSYGTSAIYNNKIGPVSVSSTTSSITNYVASGMRLDVASNSTVNVFNNFIFGITSGQTSATTSAPDSIIQATGISMGVTAGTANLYFNSIRVECSVNINSACITSTGGTANTMVFKNNIFSNFTAGQTGVPKHYIIMRQRSSGTLTGLDYNDYYIANSGNGYVGYYTADKSTLSDWRTSFTPNMDSYSFSANPPFTSATDLHLLTGVATLLESGGTPISTPAITTDIDGVTRNVTTPDIGADEGNFTAVSKSISWMSVNQASTAVVYPNTQNQEILRIDICVLGSAGTLPLNSINVNSKNMSDADVSAVKLYRTSSPVFSSANPVGSATTFSGGNASFNSLNYDLPASTLTYIWIVYDVDAGAIEGNTLDANILANQIDINGSTYLSSDSDPAGTRTIVSAMNGIYTIDQAGSGSRNYLSFTSALADLNLRGINASVIFNVAPGFTESITAPLVITATGSLSNSITFRKDEGKRGTNPLITRTDAGVLTTTSLGSDGDAVIKINGTDYLVIDGIDVIADQSGIEYGYYLYKPSGTDGCKYVEIKNCAITMTKSTASSVVVGILISNGPTSVSSSAGVTVTDISGRNENITIRNNTIQNVNSGIYTVGYNDPASPYVYYDQNFSIGTAGAGNTISNFYWASSSGSSFGIYTSYCNNVDVSYNTLSNTVTPNTSFTYGIYSSYTKYANINYSYNTISMSSSGTRSLYPFSNNAGDANSTLNIHHNIIENCVHGSSSIFGAINNGVSSVTMNIYSNIIRNNTISTGSSSMIIPSSVDTANIYDNVISNNSIANAGTNTAFTISGGVVNFYRNSISAYNVTTAARLYALSISGGNELNVYNNLIYGLSSAYSDSADAIDAIRGISITSSTVNSLIKLYNNTVYLNATSGGTHFWTSCVYHTYNATATTAALDMRNNIFVNNSTPNGTGRTVAFRRSASTNLNNYSTLSNNNLFYAGTPGASNLIFYDGLNSDQTITTYKTRVTPSDAKSVSGDPGFTSPTNLLPDNTSANAWNVYKKGIQITMVSNDYAGTARSTTIAGGPTCIGAYEFNINSVTNPPPAATQSGTIGANLTSIYTQSYDTLMNITWGTTLDNMNLNNSGSNSNSKSGSIHSRFGQNLLPGTVTIKKFSGFTPPDTATGIMKKVGKGYWFVDADEDPISPVSVKVYWGNEELGSINDTSKLILAMYDMKNRVWLPFERGISGNGYSIMDNEYKTITVNGLPRIDSVIFALTAYDSPVKRFKFDLTAIIKGFYHDNGTGTFVMKPDSILVVVRDTVGPNYTALDTIKMFQTDSLGHCSGFTSLANTGGYGYYLQIIHLNSLDTWTPSGPIGQLFSMVLGTLVYDFTSAQTQAYGNNMVLGGDGLKWCIINGDCNRDNYIDGSDYLEIINNYDTGGAFLKGDTNGDDYVDGSDYLAVINNYDIGSTSPLSALLKSSRKSTDLKIKVQVSKKATNNKNLNNAK